MKSLNIHTAALAAALLTTLALVPATPAAAEDALGIYWNIGLGRIQSELAEQAEQHGTPVLRGNVKAHSTATILSASGQLESAEELTLDGLGDGVDLAYAFLSARDLGIEADYYTTRLVIDEPTRTESSGTLSLVDRDGRSIAETIGDYAVAGEVPPPGETFFVTCENSYGPGVDDEGNSCVNVVSVCTGWTATFVFQGCLKVVE